MKNVVIIAVALVVLLASCVHPSDAGKKRGSSGKTLEMLLVANPDVYVGDTKQLIDTIFRAPQLGLPQVEPMFDVVNIPRSSFENAEMFRAHRNVLILDLGEGNPDKVYLYRDRWATPQVVIEIAAASRRSLDSLIVRYAAQTVSEMHEADYRRIDKVFASTAGTELMREVEQQFGCPVLLPDNQGIYLPEIIRADISGAEVFTYR